MPPLSWGQVLSLLGLYSSNVLVPVKGEPLPDDGELDEVLGVCSGRVGEVGMKWGG